MGGRGNEGGEICIKGSCEKRPPTTQSTKSRGDRGAVKGPETWRLLRLKFGWKRKTKERQVKGRKRVYE